MIRCRFVTAKETATVTMAGRRRSAIEEDSAAASTAVLLRLVSSHSCSLLWDTLIVGNVNKMGSGKTIKPLQISHESSFDIAGVGLCSLASHSLLLTHKVFCLRPLPQKRPAHLLPAGAPPAGGSDSGAALRVQERHSGPVSQRKPLPPAQVKLHFPGIFTAMFTVSDAGVMVWLLKRYFTGYTRLKTEVRQLRQTSMCTLRPRRHRWLPRLM